MQRFLLLAALFTLACSDPTAPRDSRFNDGSPPPASSASPRSHIRTMMTDFYYNWTNEKRDVAAARFDMVLGGSLTEWKKRNPAVKHIPYMLHWTVIQDPKFSVIKQLEEWFSSRPECTLENAFLHKPGTSKSKSNRITMTIWGSARWIHNPADSCWRRYQIDRLKEAMARGHDGVFYDEYGTGLFGAARKSLELPTADAYYAALTDALRGEKAAVGQGFIIMLNTAEFMEPADAAMVDAAGATHLELFNDLTIGAMQDRWKFIEARLAAGAVVEVVGRRNWRSGLPSSVTPGNYRDASRDGFAAGMYRQKMGELASYYMVRPKDPSRFYFDDNNDNWSVSPTTHWMKAKEVDIGEPTESRTLMVNTTGSDGQAVRVWRREYTQALILARPSADWNDGGFGDASGHKVSLPSGTWRLLHDDGTLGSPISSITLRKGEGAILMKG